MLQLVCVSLWAKQSQRCKNISDPEPSLVHSWVKEPRRCDVSDAEFPIVHNLVKGQRLAYLVNLMLGRKWFFLQSHNELSEKNKLSPIDRSME